MKKEQIQRIYDMEKRLDRAAAAAAALSDAVSHYCEILPELQTLKDYYTSPLWLQDYEDDCAGRLPQNLKRGVLSEDSIHNLLCENRTLLEQLRHLSELPSE